MLITFYIPPILPSPSYTLVLHPPTHTIAACQQLVEDKIPQQHTGQFRWARRTGLSPQFGTSLPDKCSSQTRTQTGHQTTVFPSGVNRGAELCNKSAHKKNKLLTCTYASNQKISELQYFF